MKSDYRENEGKAEIGKQKAEEFRPDVGLKLPAKDCGPAEALGPASGPPAGERSDKHPTTEDAGALAGVPYAVEVGSGLCRDGLQRVRLETAAEISTEFGPSVGGAGAGRVFIGGASAGSEISRGKAESGKQKAESFSAPVEGAVGGERLEEGSGEAPSFQECGGACPVGERQKGKSDFATAAGVVSGEIPDPAREEQPGSAARGWGNRPHESEAAGADGEKQKAESRKQKTNEISASVGGSSGAVLGLVGEAVAFDGCAAASFAEGKAENRKQRAGGPADVAVVKAGEWEGLFNAWEAMRQQGMTRREACRELGTSEATLSRVVNHYAKRGFESRVENCGRRSSWEHLVENTTEAPSCAEATAGTQRHGGGGTEGVGSERVSESVRGNGTEGTEGNAFARKLLEIYLATIGASGGNVVRGRRTAKMATALQCMAEEPECPAELARLLRRGKYPACLLRFLRRITPELENRMRGPKHFQLNGITSRRDLTVRFGDGSRAEMPAGFKWVFDDMSVNQPFYAMFGNQVLFSRQGLYAIDHRSMKWLGKMLVARPREAYRAEDILRFCRHLFEVYGKPDVIVFERGVWASRRIKGYKVGGVAGLVEEEECERPEMASTEREAAQTGLASIGVRLIFATSAHGKIIEGGFNFLQDIIAVKAREFNNIGRYAGEFEAPAKRLRQVRSGSREPGAVGFASMAELSERIDQAMALINARRNGRGEVPDQVWEEGVGSQRVSESVRGNGTEGTEGTEGKRPLRKLEPEDYAVFLPERRERSIDGGRVTVTVAGEQHDFRADWMAELGSGFKVYLHFDPSEPPLGAAVYNRECGPANHKEYRLGQFIGFAAWEMPAPSVDVVGTVRGLTPLPVETFYGAGAVDQGDTVRKGQARLVATAFSALPRPGQPAVRVAEVRDGEGRVAKAESGKQKAERGTLGHSDSRTLGPEKTGRNAIALPTEDEWAKKQKRLAARGESARAMAATVGAGE